MTRSSRCRRLRKRVVRQGQAAGADFGNPDGRDPVVTVNGDKIVPGGKPVGRQRRAVDDQPVSRGLPEAQVAAQPDRSERFAVKIALGLTGQFSWQTMQGRSMAQGRQRPRSTKAMPMRMGPRELKSPFPRRSSRRMGRMAAVGHRLPQAMQPRWQPLVPIRKLSIGVQMPSMPA